MCAGHGAGNGTPSFRAFVTNWSRYDAPPGTKLRLTVRNLWRRIVLRQNCCGNHGQPGC
jgi:hypothetical protein